jgi:undecaprenyl-diphosphatase
LSSLEALLLGLLQGATEFLPVSSSGHLVIVQAFMKVLGSGVGFEVLLHVATLGAIVICLRREVAALVKGSLRVVRLLPTVLEEERRERRLALAVIAGTVPAAAATLLFGSTLKAAFTRPEWAGRFLLITGAVLMGTRFGRDKHREIGLGVGFIIGLAQAAALLPGISRSGFTIAAAIFLGVPRGDALRFSFLLALPAVGGAFLYTLLPGEGSVLEVPLVPSAFGFGAALISGCAAILILLRAVRRGRFEFFGIYCVLVGLIAMVLL